MDPIQAATRLFDSPSRRFPVRLWDGTVLPPSGDAVAAVLVLKRRSALAALAPPVSESRLAEAYLDGDLELEGDAIALVEAAARWDGPRLSVGLAPALGAALVERVVHLPPLVKLLARPGGAFATPRARRPHSVARDRHAVQHHYDVSDEFYRLFLDREMVYSCAYFAREGDSIEAAQRAKVDLVCRKLRLSPRERFLDVGCGWGALVLHAATEYGVEAVGVTLSDNQLAEARRRKAALGTGHVEIRAADYRRLGRGERFDKIASVGMMEHVGRSHLDQYFSALDRHLAPGGLLLNHAIADVSGGRNTLAWAGRRNGKGFIDRYIFPDGDLVPLPLVLAAAERAGFEVRDVESLREHYAQTCTAWLRRLEARAGEAERLVGPRRYRAFRLYLAGSAAAFRLGRISVFQTLLAKRMADGRAAGVPRTRVDWYSEAPRSRPTAAGGA